VDYGSAGKAPSVKNERGKGAEDIKHSVHCRDVNLGGRVQGVLSFVRPGENVICERGELGRDIGEKRLSVNRENRLTEILLERDNLIADFAEKFLGEGLAPPESLKQRIAPSYQKRQSFGQNPIHREER
jgi:hypothetical protein